MRVTTDLADAWTILDEQEEQANAWRKGPSISADDLRLGTGVIQRLPANAVALAAAQDRQTDQQNDGASPTQRQHNQGVGGAGQIGNSRPRPKPLVITFGTKHRGELAVNVRENDPGYWRWAMENLPFFAKQVRAAGLDDEQDDL